MSLVVVLLLVVLLAGGIAAAIYFRDKSSAGNKTATREALACTIPDTCTCCLNTTTQLNYWDCQKDCSSVPLSEVAKGCPNDAQLICVAKNQSVDTNTL